MLEEENVVEEEISLEEIESFYTGFLAWIQVCPLVRRGMPKFLQKKSYIFSAFVTFDFIVRTITAILKREIVVLQRSNSDVSEWSEEGSNDEK